MENKFKECWITRTFIINGIEGKEVFYKNPEIPAVHYIEYSALESANAEIAELSKKVDILEKQITWHKENLDIIKTAFANYITADLKMLEQLNQQKEEIK